MFWTGFVKMSLNIMKNRYGISIHQNTIISANSQLLLPELLCAPRGRQAAMTLLLQNLQFDFVDQVVNIAFLCSFFLFSKTRQKGWQRVEDEVQGLMTQWSGVLRNVVTEQLCPGWGHLSWPSTAANTLIVSTEAATDAASAVLVDPTWDKRIVCGACACVWVCVTY